MTSVKPSLGAVTRELIREAIVATCEQMSLAVIRTSHSETVKSAMDFSTAICDASGETVGQGVTLPNQLGAIPDAMASYVRGNPNEAVHALIRANCRIPDVVLGDFAAQVVACRTGEAGFLKLVEAYGLTNLLEHLHELLDYTEALTRAEIRSLLDGVFQYTDYMDDDGVHPEHIVWTPRGCGSD